MIACSHIDNPFAREWVTAQFESRRGVYTPLCYIDINEGNHYDADVFAQIMYWHEPAKNGDLKLNCHRPDSSGVEYWWLDKNHRDWLGETRTRRSTVRKSLERLKARRLIVVEVFNTDEQPPQPKPHIRVNWEEFERRMRLWMTHVPRLFANEREYDAFLRLFAVEKPAAPPVPPVTTGQGVRPQITGGVSLNNRPPVTTGQESYKTPETIQIINTNTSFAALAANAPAARESEKADTLVSGTNQHASTAFAPLSISSGDALSAAPAAGGGPLTALPLADEKRTDAGGNAQQAGEGGDSGPGFLRRPRVRGKRMEEVGNRVIGPSKQVYPNLQAAMQASGALPLPPGYFGRLVMLPAALDYLIAQGAKADAPPAPRPLTDEQAAVILYFDWKRPQPGESYPWSMLNKMVNFFAARISPSTKDAWAQHQLTETPLTAAQILGFKLWFQAKFPTLTHPSKPDTIATQVLGYLFDDRRAQYEQQARERIAAFQRGEEVPPSGVAPAPHTAPETPPVSEWTPETARAAIAAARESMRRAAQGELA